MYQLFFGIIIGVVLHKYRWKIAYKMFNATVLFISRCKQKFTMKKSMTTEQTDVSHLTRYTFYKNGTPHSFVLYPKHVPSLEKDIKRFSEAKNEFLACFIKSYYDLNNSTLLDVTSVMKDLVYYTRTPMDLRNSTLSKTDFLRLCGVHEGELQQLVIVDENMNESEVNLFELDDDMDIRDILQKRKEAAKTL